MRLFIGVQNVCWSLQKMMVAITLHVDAGQKCASCVTLLGFRTHIFVHKLTTIIQNFGLNNYLSIYFQFVIFYRKLKIRHF